MAKQSKGALVLSRMQNYFHTFQKRGIIYVLSHENYWRQYALDKRTASLTPLCAMYVYISFG